MKPSLTGSSQLSVLAAARAALGGLDLDAEPDVAAALAAAGVDPVRFAWRHEAWAGRDAAFFLRWALIGHVHHHVGEMVAVRDRLGLSPF